MKTKLTALLLAAALALTLAACGEKDHCGHAAPRRAAGACRRAARRGR